MYNGVICDNTVQIRRLSFVAHPGYLFMGMGLKIMRYDDDITSGFHSQIRTDEITPYLVD